MGKCDMSPEYAATMGFFPVDHVTFDDHLKLTGRSDETSRAEKGTCQRLSLTTAGRSFQRDACWENICHAILEAHHMIYIVGWSVYDKVRLVREPSPSRPLPEGGDLTLGELLNFKSQEGVRVCLLVWDDKTSHDKLFIKTGGVMSTHDEETQKFFKHSSVICVLSPRYASNKLSIFKQQKYKCNRDKWTIATE